MEVIISLCKWIMACGTIFMIAFFVLLGMPQSRLRSVGMQIVKWLTAAGLVLLVISPVDFIPDVIPLLGWGDDAAYLIGAFCAARSARKEGVMRAEPSCLPQEDGDC